MLRDHDCFISTLLLYPLLPSHWMPEGERSLQGLQIYTGYAVTVVKGYGSNLDVPMSVKLCQCSTMSSSLKTIFFVFKRKGFYPVTQTDFSHTEQSHVGTKPVCQKPLQLLQCCNSPLGSFPDNLLQLGFSTCVFLSFGVGCPTLNDVTILYFLNLFMIVFIVFHQIGFYC